MLAELAKDPSGGDTRIRGRPRDLALHVRVRILDGGRQGLRGDLLRVQTRPDDSQQQPQHQAEPAARSAGTLAFATAASAGTSESRLPCR